MLGHESSHERLLPIVVHCSSVHPSGLVTQPSYSTLTEFELSAEGQGRISRAVPAPRAWRAKQVTRDTGAACGSRIADSRGRLIEGRIVSRQGSTTSPLRAWVG